MRRALHAFHFVFVLLLSRVDGFLHHTRIRIRRTEDVSSDNISPSSVLFAASQSSPEGVRLNKAFKSTHSRREADRLIAERRVQVNGVTPDTMGVRLMPGDHVTLDGKAVEWERLNRNEPTGKKGVHTYVKYWKPRGVECTTDRRVRGNILDALGQISGVSDRLWPMGRLDKDSTGLILLTTDGPTTQRVLKSETKKWKTYLVETDRRASDDDIQKLARGVEIISHTSRDGNTKTRLITTEPAIVERGPQSKRYRNQLLFQIHEGKNRQIRRMCQALGMEVKRLHRIDFAGISLEGCPSPGKWAFLTPKEVEILKSY